MTRNTAPQRDSAPQTLDASPQEKARQMARALLQEAIEDRAAEVEGDLTAADRAAAAEQARDQAHADRQQAAQQLRRIQDIYQRCELATELLATVCEERQFVTDASADLADDLAAADGMPPETNGAEDSEEDRPAGVDPSLLNANGERE